MSALSSRAFNQDTSAAKRAAEQGPVVITDRGRPAYVLMTYAACERSRGPQLSAADALAMPEDGEFETEFPRVALAARDIDLE